jgi:hypothetical protein
MILKTREEIVQVIADNPNVCWYTLSDIDMLAWASLPKEYKDLIDAARPNCGYHCREKKCPVTGERSR